MPTRIYVVNDREDGTDLKSTLLRWEIQDETGKKLVWGDEELPAVKHYGRCYIEPNIQLPAKLPSNKVNAKLVLKLTKIEYGKNLLLKGVPIIFNKGGAKLKIGENTTIKSSFLSNLVGLYSRTIIVTRAPGAEIEIGDNVGISGATIYARKKITIGENTCIGGNCKILDNDFHPIETETRNKLLRDENGGDSDLVPSREIKIGKNCFIGCNSIILKGTVLGDGCVVGAGAVVCGKFEDNCVIAGNPARVIKRLEGNS